MKQQSRKYYNIAFQLLLLKTENSTSTHFLGMLDSDEEKKKISSQPTFMLHCDCKSAAPYSPSHMGMSVLLLEFFPLQEDIQVQKK